ncbi:MAG TPA: TIGR03435 family protein [Candidatus Acidoferrales bacterium]|nr:TIGR03435 family protein [Candidatus Acidoferrales bacterium]
MLLAAVLMIGLAWPAPMLAQSNGSAAANTPAAAAPATPPASPTTPAATPATSAAAPATAATTNYEFEVASIKRSKSGELMPGFSPNAGDEIKMSNMPFEAVVVGAFGLMPNQLLGAPDWLMSERYDFDAKMDPATADALKKLSTDDRKAAREHMLQALLADRCKLKFHKESRELPTYTLVVAKNGPKFHESKPGETVPAGTKVPDGHGGTITMQMKAGAISLWGAPMSVLVPMLTGILGHPVADKTGLTGKYDFTWQIVPTDMSQLRPPATGAAGMGQSAAAAAPTPGPAGGFPGMDPAAMAASIQEQLGLKLEMAKGPVEVVVIDHMERPSED